MIFIDKQNINLHIEIVNIVIINNVIGYKSYTIHIRNMV